MVYEVVFYIENEITFKESPRIDAVIQAIYFQLNPCCNIKDDVPLPINRVQLNNTWFYDCSFAQYETKSVELDTINKQINPYELNKNKLVIGSGKYCSNIRTFERYTIKKMTYYINSDNLNELETYLNNVTHLGGLRKCNFGKVERIEIHKTDRECAWKHNGITLRDIPCPEKLAFELMLRGGIVFRNACIRPPYNPEQGVDQQFIIMPPFIITETI